MSASGLKGRDVNLEIKKEGKAVTFKYSGSLDTYSVPQIWYKTFRALDSQKPHKLTVQASDVEYCDGAGLSIFFELKLRSRTDRFSLNIEGLKPEFREMLDMFDARQFDESRPRKRKKIRAAEEVGKSTVNLLGDLSELVTYIGQLSVSMGTTVLHPSKVRWKDVIYIAEKAGVNSAGIITLIGFLFGLIMAFSGVISLQKYGAQIYVADMVAISMLRVLGPFITAVMLAGRSGSAFAAEIGTMKINEEVDALRTMGFEPISFLAIPRVLAAFIATPLLCMVANAAALVGSAMVLLSLGVPLVTYYNRVTGAVDYGDFFGGLFKALTYGILIGGIGCLRGLQTKAGPSAVGDSTTSAVVSTIILVVAAEGVYAVLFYVLGI
jgi:phospholipid/cholesterol/gamma-HCH transport system permease protein